MSFDANLNPSLVDTYLSAVKEQFCDKGIRAILTTHSPSTVVGVKPEELYELSIENGNHTLMCANDKQGMQKILKKLAPKFVYYGELGILGYLAEDIDKEIIILVEGKNDQEKPSNIRE